MPGRRRVLAANHPDRLLSIWCVADSLLKTHQGKEAIPLIDEYVTAVAAMPAPPISVAQALEARLRHFQKLADGKGCFVTSTMWTQHGLRESESESLFTAARFRAVTASVNTPPTGDADVDADTAMGWLHKAVAAGYRDRARLETDADFAALRGRSDFKKLLETLPAK